MVYGQQIIHPEIPFPKETPVDIRLSPTSPPRRPATLTLQAQVHTHQGARKIAFDLLTPTNATPIVQQGSLHQVIAAFSRLDKEQHDPYVTVLPDDQLQLGELYSVYQFLRSIESDVGIRLEPEPQPWLNHILWFPPHELTNIATRTIEPMTLHFEDTTNGVQVIAQFHDIEFDDQDRATTNTFRHVLNEPAGVLPALESFTPLIPVTLVYAHQSMPYADWLHWMKDARQAFPETFLFLHPKGHE